jgi:hypothetical protein
MGLSKEDLIGKFIQIESWAFRARHLLESQSSSSDKILNCVKHIRHDLEELEIILKVED